MAVKESDFALDREITNTDQLIQALKESLNSPIEKNGALVARKAETIVFKLDVRPAEIRKMTKIPFGFKKSHYFKANAGYSVTYKTLSDDVKEFTTGQLPFEIEPVKADHYKIAPSKSTAKAQPDDPESKLSKIVEDTLKEKYHSLSLEDKATKMDLQIVKFANRVVDNIFSALNYALLQDAMYFSSK
ncbi:MAG: hypothetical protein H0U27_09025 [Nitrosopumilus sp.]|nr:hypothetical protein [Nitrosopumilus sp.]